MIPYSHDTFGHIDSNRVFGCVYICRRGKAAYVRIRREHVGHIIESDGNRVFGCVYAGGGRRLI